MKALYVKIKGVKSAVFAIKTISLDFLDERKIGKSYRKSSKQFFMRRERLLFCFLISKTYLKLTISKEERISSNSDSNTTKLK